MLAVVLGVLSMHHLGSGHGAMTATPMTATLLAATPMTATPETPALGDQSSVVTVPGHAQPVRVPACLAVLLLGAAALVGGGGRHGVRPRHLDAAAAKRSSPPRPGPPPRDLLAQLCVLRT